MKINEFGNLTGIGAIITIVVIGSTLILMQSTQSIEKTGTLDEQALKAKKDWTNSYLMLGKITSDALADQAFETMAKTSGKDCNSTEIGNQIEKNNYINKIQTYFAAVIAKTNMNCKILSNPEITIEKSNETTINLDATKNSSAITEETPIGTVDLTILMELECKKEGATTSIYSNKIELKKQLTYKRILNKNPLNEGVINFSEVYKNSATTVTELYSANYPTKPSQWFSTARGTANTKSSVETTCFIGIKDQLTGKEEIVLSETKGNEQNSVNCKFVDESFNDSLKKTSGKIASQQREKYLGEFSCTDETTTGCPLTKTLYKDLSTGTIVTTQTSPRISCKYNANPKESFETTFNEIGKFNGIQCHYIARQIKNFCKNNQLITTDECDLDCFAPPIGTKSRCAWAGTMAQSNITESRQDYWCDAAAALPKTVQGPNYWCYNEGKTQSEIGNGKPTNNWTILGENPTRTYETVKNLYETTSNSDGWYCINGLLRKGTAPTHVSEDQTVYKNDTSTTTDLKQYYCNSCFTGANNSSCVQAKSAKYCLTNDSSYTVSGPKYLCNSIGSTTGNDWFNSTGSNYIKPEYYSGFFCKKGRYEYKDTDGCPNCFSTGNCLKNACAPPTTPNLNAAPGDTQVTLNWNSVDNAVKYKIERSSSSGSGFAEINTMQNENHPIGLSDIDSGLTNLVTYYYRIRACNKNYDDSDDCSAYSAVVSAKPIPPALLKSIAINNPDNQTTIGKSATIQFNAIGTFEKYNEQTEQIETYTTEITSNAKWNSSNSAAISINSSGIATGIEYGTSNITASQINARGSTITSSAIPINVVPPTPILSLSQAPGQYGFTANWNNTGATRYDLQYRTSSASFETNIYPYDQPSTSKTITGLTNNTTYYVKIRGCESVNCSNFSPEQSITVQLSPPETPAIHGQGGYLYGNYIETPTYGTYLNGTMVFMENRPKITNATILKVGMSPADHSCSYTVKCTINALNFGGTERRDCIEGTGYAVISTGVYFELSFVNLNYAANGWAFQACNDAGCSQWSFQRYSSTQPNGGDFDKTACPVQ